MTSFDGTHDWAQGQSIGRLVCPSSGQACVLVLDSQTPLGAWVSGLLTEQERAQCAQYHRLVDRQCAAAMRGLWKLGAGALTRTDPRTIQSKRTPLGRPEINGIGDRSIDLNVSRTGQWCGLVLSGSGRCGIDIEQVDPAALDSVRAEHLMGTLIQDSECDGQQFARNPENPEFFFDRWTRAEAVLKADGRGLSQEFEGVRRIEVGQGGAEVWETGPKKWIVYPIQTPEGVVGSCAFGDACVSMIEIDVSGLASLV